MDESVVEELQFHQQTVASDDNSPLHLIREKELEISGRVLATKRQADEIVAEARQKAAAMVTSAHEDAKGVSEVRRKEIRAELEQQVADEQVGADRGIEELQATIEQRRERAIAFVVDSVLGK